MQKSCPAILQSFAANAIIITAKGEGCGHGHHLGWNLHLVTSLSRPGRGQQSGQTSANKLSVDAPGVQARCACFSNNAATPVPLRQFNSEGAGG